MTHFEITMQKQAMARRGIEDDLALELRSYPNEPNSFAAQFGKFIGETYPNAKPRPSGNAVGSSLAMIRQTPIYRVNLS